VEQDTTEAVVTSDAAEGTQEFITGQINRLVADYTDRGVVETQPRLDYSPYRSSILRHPTKDLRHADPETIELGRKTRHRKRGVGHADPMTFDRVAIRAGTSGGADGRHEHALDRCAAAEHHSDELYSSG